MTPPPISTDGATRRTPVTRRPFSHASDSEYSREDGSCQEEHTQEQRDYTKEKNRSPRIEEHRDPLLVSGPLYGLGT